jgi:nicotinamidase-related amidase
MLKKTTGVVISDLFLRQSTDLVLERSSIITFEETQLESILKSRGIKTLLLYGVLSDIWVEGTMRVACSKGYEIFTVKDVTSTLDLDKHYIPNKTIFHYFLKPLILKGNGSLLDKY